MAPKPTTIPDRRLVSIETAGDYVDTCPRTVRNWVAAGLLTGYRVGPRLLRVDLNEVDAMLRPVPTAVASAC